MIYEIWLILQCIMGAVLPFRKLCALMWCHYLNHRGQFSSEGYNTEGHYPLLISARVRKWGEHQSGIADMLYLLKKYSLVAIN